MSLALLEFAAVIEMPFGGIGVRTAEGAVSEMVYLPASIAPVKPRDPLAREVARQIKAYVKHPSHRFDLPLATRGSAFQRKVWEVIASIPAGHTLSYGEVARRIRSAPRAVGQACGANWFSLVVPCHRVLAAHGIGGFGSDDDGFPMQIKRWLLAHERVPGYV